MGLAAMHLQVAVEVLPPTARPLAYALFALVGGLLGYGLARHAAALGRRRAMLALLLANPYSWIAAALLLIAPFGLFSPDAMGLGPAIGLLALGLGLLYAAWLAGFGRALMSVPAATLYGAFSGLLLAGLPGPSSPLGPWGLLVGLALAALSWPRNRPGAPGPAPRAALRAPRGR